MKKILTSCARDLNAPFTTYILLFISVQLYSQDTLKKTRISLYPYNSSTDFKPKIKEEFYVLKTDTTIKHGTYSSSKLNGTSYINGHYKNGERNGVWYFYDYDTNVLFEKYDYDTRKDLYYLTEKSQLRIASGKTFKNDSVDSPPHLPGEKGFSILFLGKEKYPQSAKDKNVSGTVYIDILIDEQGTVSILEFDYSQEIKGSGLENDFKNSVIDAIKIIPKYVPAIKNGKYVAVRFDKIPRKFTIK